MIIPAIDILNNKIVRLYQGNYDLVQYYNYNVYDLIEKYLFYGINMVHIVDLNSARNPFEKKNQVFYNILSYFKNKIQIAGGIRSEKDIEYFLLNGAKRVVIGSAIFNKKNKIKNWIKYYGSEYIVIALDINIINNVNNVFINGWKENTNICLEDILKKLSYLGIKYILCTDISRDGTLLGPNFKLYRNLINSFPNFYFQSSGGISSVNDIIQLKKIGIHDIIIGKSLLEKKFNIMEAIKCWQKESSLASM
ncbi:1-(5-phosphoribosyl)-5-[(5-phosphoribosylamino)methylideneamino] imidazole-4-carboxamide isomerase [Buchnera aphidicola]|uniref:1-(5-phosphoribosyl)-5-[(5-phosphoribosylamino)methylideneamino] imidazole-4-carboxamide isomerase n=1 Tax=Buchnera aphidicola (Therioaphis trifolii) TaxID=1241884 RepID=A0A4D6YAU2_9GAMM|nr:1-(5-phosphoribosyl)-5-[(5-phosphoribosylamino)methylideneamino] imidazole-4-carboxamide isomerase [Buchnera aphidicola]QCI27086.1 1-(5-phosphoribosyl)-5-[(5-phosphoribosylamino)methylideneamino] imidazole-4-carboxamide isomerase [Buchnera aphidicola (Therioaphis trifolii)]